MPPPAQSKGGGGGVVVVVRVCVCLCARTRVLGLVGGKCTRACTHTRPPAEGPGGAGPLSAVVVRIIYRAPTLPSALPPSGCFCLFVFLEKVMIWGLDHLLAYW